MKALTGWSMWDQPFPEMYMTYVDVAGHNHWEEDGHDPLHQM